MSWLKNQLISRQTYSDLEALCAELREAQYDTLSPARFENVLGRAFAFLGFDAEQIGGAGNADVIAHAALGEDSFTIVIDAKTAQAGAAKNKGGIDYLAVRKHHTGEYWLILA